MQQPASSRRWRPPDLAPAAAEAEVEAGGRRGTSDAAAVASTLRLRAPCGLPVWPLVPCGQTRWPDGPSVILFGPRVGGTAQFHRYTAPPVKEKYVCAKGK